MGKDLAETFPASRQVFEEADAALGFSLSELCFNGPAEQLQLTENTQPAILTVSVAALRAMESEGFPRPEWVLREYSRGGFRRSFNLDESIDTQNISAKYVDGVLQVTLPIIAGKEVSKKEIVIN